MFSIKWMRSTVIIACLVACGCGGGGYSGPTGSLAGKVMVGGQPATEGTSVQIIHQELGYASSARVNAEGSYSFGSLPTGKYDVGFAPPTSATSGGSTDPDELNREIAAGTYEPPEVTSNIPEKLRNPATSGESADVAEGANQRDFNL